MTGSQGGWGFSPFARLQCMSGAAVELHSVSRAAELRKEVGLQSCLG